MFDMNIGIFILDENKNPVRLEDEDCLKWAMWKFHNSNLIHVARTTIGNHLISTVFLGQAYVPEFTLPLLFETMIFGLNDSTTFDRYPTWNSALSGHDRACTEVRERLNLPLEEIEDDSSIEE